MSGTTWTRAEVPGSSQWLGNGGPTVGDPNREPTRGQRARRRARANAARLQQGKAPRPELRAGDCGDCGGWGEIGQGKTRCPACGGTGCRP